MNSEAIFNTLPQLESGQLQLRKVEQTHLEDLFTIYSNDDVFQYCGIIPKHNKDTVLNMIGHFERDFNKKTRVKWGIFSNENPNSLLGIIEAFNFNQKVNTVSIGYFLAEQHWGKGIASEALKTVIEFLITKVNINRIQAEVMPANENSKRVLIKNGFIKEGTLRQAAFWSGKGVVDLEIYSILRDDFN